MDDKEVFNFTEKQKLFIKTEDSRLNFLCGSVRSGKTFISLIKFFLVVASSPKDYEFIMCGKTLMSLKRNCLNLMQSFVGKKNFKYSTTAKQGVLFGHTIYLEGANDESSEQKIRGMTLAGAYCDEVTLYPKSFFAMLLSRLSVKGAKLYATCNPDTPNHYIKKEYIDRAEELNCSVWNFLLTDNTFLPPEYIESVSKEYSGVFYNRFILGQWVRAEGIIYGKFANNTADYLLPRDFNFNELIQINIGVDFGGSGSATTFVCTGFTRFYKEVIVLEAERHPEELSPEMLDKLYHDFVKLCTDKYRKFATTYADSAEQILIRGLRNTAERNSLRTSVNNARKMPILERIRLVCKLIGQGRFKVAPHCTSVICALQDAVWDEKKENERLDDGTTDIDTLDAMEYSIEPNFRDIMDFTELRR